MSPLTVAGFDGGRLLGEVGASPTGAHISGGGSGAEGQVPAGVHRR